MTDKSEIKAIIFDLGNVLIDFDHTIAAKRILGFSDKTLLEIFNLFFDSEVTALFEEGKISPQDFFLKVKDMLNLKLDYPGFLPIWNEIFYFSEKNRSVYDLVNRLKERYKLALLSNINILHFEYLKKNFPFFTPFHSIITSFEMGMRKPNPLIYQHAVSALGTFSNANVFYTDDRPELIQKAQGLGIRSFLFKDEAGLERDLEAQGININ